MCNGKIYTRESLFVQDEEDCFRGKDLFYLDEEEFVRGGLY